jgi:hypothetical protein
MRELDIHEDLSRPSQRSPWRRRIVWGGLLVLVLGLVGPYAFFVYHSHTELEEAFAEADRTDPAWRLQDVEARRMIVPDDENSAIRLMDAKQLMPRDWPAFRNSPALTDKLSDEELRDLEESLWDPEPPVLLDARQLAVVRAEMKRVEAALPLACKVADLPRGRYPIVYTPDYVSMRLDHTQDARSLANLLALHALLRAQEQDIEGAMDSCRALINTNRSIGDEPTLISMLVRIAIRRVALKKIERVLAQGQPSEKALAAVQRLLEEDEPEPLLLIGARGERALMDGLMENIQNGQVSLAQLKNWMGSGRQNSPFGDVEDLELLLLAGSVKHNRAALLRFYNRVVEIARRPVEEQRTPLQQLEAEVPALPRLARMLFASLKVADADLSSHMDLRCGIAMLAAERYRRAHGHWPAALTDLVPAYLAKVPLDPFDGAPLRYRRLKDGVVIYSVGFDGQDDGGNLSDHTRKPGTDRGVRLWDVAQRRQPPRPRNKSKDN